MAAQLAGATWVEPEKAQRHSLTFASYCTSVKAPSFAKDRKVRAIRFYKRPVYGKLCFDMRQDQSSKMN